MLKLRVNFKGRCPKHHNYDPGGDGEAGIKGGCQLCGILLNMFRAWERFEAQRVLFEAAKSDPAAAAKAAKR